MFEDFHKGDLTISNFNFGMVCTGSLIRAAWFWVSMQIFYHMSGPGIVSACIIHYFCQLTIELPRIEFPYLQLEFHLVFQNSKVLHTDSDGDKH
jgi:hypothetical protein